MLDFRLVLLQVLISTGRAYMYKQALQSPTAATPQIDHKTRDNIVGGLEAEAISTDYRGSS